jgi:hypothetical protein
MLRDFRSALILAALTGTLYALGIYLSPLHSNVGDGAWNLLVLLGIVLSATGFVVEFVASRLSRRLRERGTVFDDRLDAIAREKAMRLNACLPTADCSSSSDERRRIRFDGAGRSLSGACPTNSATALPVPPACSLPISQRRQDRCEACIADVFSWGREDQLEHRASHSLSLDHLRLVCFPFTAMASAFF